MQEKRDISTIDDVRLFVDRFYEQVRHDDLLAPIFDDRVTGKWPKHLEKMYSFWATLLLGEYQYQGNPYLMHAELPIDHSHFSRWLQLFNSVIDENFYGEKADEAKRRANKIAQIFENKIENAKTGKFKPLV